MKSPATRKGRHALAKSGPIVDRARKALNTVAEQFGEVRRTDKTSVVVDTADGLHLVLSYNPGNFVFSRVYNLSIATRLPDDSPVPGGVELSHRGSKGPRYVAPENSSAELAHLERLNALVGPHLDGIDLHSSNIVAEPGGKYLNLTPLGGSYVWVLIPPVFKATAFPPGEPRRILDLIHAVRCVRRVETDTASTTTKGSPDE